MPVTTPSNAPSTDRLVIRIKLIPQEPPRHSTKWRVSKNALLLTAGVVAVLLSWLAISTFGSDPAVRPEVPTVVRDEPPPKAAPKVAMANSIEVRPPETPPTAVNEVIPDVPRSALDTIRGTVRVSVRVIVDEQGTVVEAAADDRGPSRYFERLAVEAARKWTFTPPASEERRTMLVRFNFTRDGASAQASPVE
jgi:TonB family protein